MPHPNKPPKGELDLSACGDRLESTALIEKLYPGGYRPGPFCAGYEGDFAEP